MMGSTPEQVAVALEEAGADVIGANCGLGMEGYVPVARGCARRPTGRSGSNRTPDCRR